jgi:DNA-binding MarR family transcriptional regulator
MVDDDFVRSLGPAFLPHMLRRLSDIMVDGGTEWARRNPALPPPRTHSTMFALELKGELSVTELAGLLRQSHPLVLQWIAVLEDLGFVSRQRDPADARRSMLRLTKSGVEAMAAIHDTRTVNEQTARQLLAELGVDLWDSLGRLEQLLEEKPYLKRASEVAKGGG